MTKTGMQKVDWEKEKVSIIRYYVEHGLSLRAIAKLYGVSFPTINKWLSRWGIPRRNGEARQRKLTKNLVGQRFGHLVVEAQDLKKQPTHWLCRCDCGRLVSVKVDRLKRNKTCGCGRGKPEGVPFKFRRTYK